MTPSPSTVTGCVPRISQDTESVSYTHLIECIATGGVPLQDVAAGANGTIIDSQDGLKWTATGPQGGAHFRGCSIVGNTGFFVGTAGTILSADLVQMNWQEAAIVTGAGLYSVASGSFYTGNFVVAVGRCV